MRTNLKFDTEQLTPSFGVYRLWAIASRFS
jgi:hypothetical protein